MDTEKEFVLNLSIDFRKILTIWMDYHKTELEKLSYNLFQQKNNTKINAYIANIELHEKIIEKQIYSI